MKNNFIPSFHKKDNENYSKTTPAFLMKNNQAISENTVKKMSLHADSFTNPADTSFPSRHDSISEEESKTSDHQNSNKSSETIIIPYKVQTDLVNQQRTASPKKYANVSLLNRFALDSTNIKQSRIGLNNSIPMRATMKNMPISKSPFMINKRQQKFTKNGDQFKDARLNSSYRTNKTFTEMGSISPSKGMQREFQQLREENESLKRELNQIKKNLGFGTATKKEDLISNLRDTIKKEDSQIKDLRVKLDIFTKKNAVLTNLIENKDQQISFLSNKLSQVENELREHKEKNAEKFEKLKERINYMIKSYNDLEVKWSQSEMEWLDFKQNWLEEKQMYLQRITFLQGYIAEGCA